VSDSEGQEGKKRRAALYVDGFNLYHPIRESGQNHLKWACLWMLGEMLATGENCQLVKVVFCTAMPLHLPESLARHQLFNAAQIARGVDVVKGHHVPVGDGYSEKQSDINVALSLICDGEDDVYDVAFLLSADSDQIATARFFRNRLAPKGKSLFAAIPPSKTVPVEYKSLGVPKRQISFVMLERCVMPAQVQGKTGLINRPAEYEPPQGWVHPADRPKIRPPKLKAGTRWQTVAKG